MERYRCRAVVLSGIDYGDSDRIIHLMTEDRGRLSAFARAARKSKRRFAGALEPFTLLNAQLTETRGDMCRLDGVEVLDGFGELRLEMARAARASYAVELVRELAREREPQGELFELLCGFLDALARRGAAASQMMRFELAALALAGLMPRLDSCSRCGVVSPPGALFDPQHGGLLCAPCARGSGIRVSPEASSVLAAMQQAEEEREAPVPAHVRAEARALLSRFVVHHLGRTPKSLEFMGQVGVEL